MSGRNRVAQVLVTLGSLVLFATTAIHSAGAYPSLSRALSASDVRVPLQQGLRAVFLLAGWDWSVIGVLALVGAFTDTRLSRFLVLFCGAAVLVQTGLTFAFTGFFVGNELLGSAAVLLPFGGLLLRIPRDA